MISFKVQNISRAYSDGRSLDNPYLDSIANIEADFEFIIGGKIVIAEPHWNIVEFAEQLNKWNNSDKDNSFIYDCIDEEQTDIFNLIKKDEEYLLLSAWARTDDEVLINETELKEFIKAYTDSVIANVKESLGINLVTVAGLELKNKNKHTPTTE